MIIGIVPKIKKNCTEYEFSVDINLIKFMKFLYPKANCKILYSEKIKLDLNLLIISGGNDLSNYNKKKEHKIRSNLDSFYLKKAIRENIPVIGICYGAQFIAHYFDSKLKKLSNHVIKKHKIFFKNSENKELLVNSYHNYVIKKLGNELSTICIAYDESVECFKHKKLNIIGLMWHPERHLPFKLSDRRIIRKSLCS